MTDDDLALPMDQRSTLTPDLTRVGHLAHEPIPGMEVCDFCTSAKVAWAYPCGLVCLPRLGFASNDPWAACETCHALIEANDRDELVAQAIRGFIRMAQVEGAPVPSLAERAQMRSTFRAIQQGFFAARSGEPTRV